MKLVGGDNVGEMGGGGAVNFAQIRHLTLVRNLRSELSALFDKSNALQPNRVCLTCPTVSSILRGRRKSQVADPVVTLDEIDMIYLHPIRDRPMDIYPREPMAQKPDIIN